MPLKKSTLGDELFWQKSSTGFCSCAGWLLTLELVLFLQEAARSPEEAFYEKNSLSSQANRSSMCTFFLLNSANFS